MFCDKVQHFKRLPDRDIYDEDSFAIFFSYTGNLFRSVENPLTIWKLVRC